MRADPSAPVSPWLSARLLVAALSVAGLAVAAYLTVGHYTESATLACPETGVVNCQRVTSSPQSVVLGVPLAVWGLVYFAGMLALTLPAAWRKPVLRRARIGLASVGALSVIYLVYVELFVVDAICLWCTAVHVITVVNFVVIVMSTALDAPAVRQRTT